MFTLTIDGKPFDPDNLRNVIIDAAVHKLKDHLHEQISSIRRPITAEFPVVLVNGTRWTTYPSVWKARLICWRLFGSVSVQKIWRN
jgi:hypothetical protein